MLVCLGLAEQLDPCQKGQVAKLGERYVIGLAFLPGKEVSEWGRGVDPSNQTVWRNPCVPTDRRALEDLGVTSAVYSLKVESLQLLRIEAGLQLLQDTFRGSPQVLSVVAYNGDMMTSPRVILRNSSASSGESGSVISVPLILQFSQGGKAVGFWKDRQCGACAEDLRGALSAAGVSLEFEPKATCMGSSSCAVDIRSCAECLRSGGAQQKAACLTFCSTTFNVGWAGTDGSSQPLISSYVITESNDFSFAGLFTDNVASAVNATRDAFQAFAGLFS